MDRRWKGIKVAREIEPISHLQFVDDTFVLGEATLSDAHIMKLTIDHYTKLLGQCVNWRKSKVFFFNTLIRKQREINRILEMRPRLLLIKYLGNPLFSGPCKVSLWKNLVDCCLRRMDGWKSRWLTSERQILMLKSGISAIPIFSMMYLWIPQKVISTIG